MGFVRTTMLSVVALVLVTIVVGLLTGFRILIVETGSMMPTLRPGDLIVDRSEPISRMHAGDIVTFRHPGLHALVTHRVVSIRQQEGRVEVTTKGDANAASESWPLPPDGRIGHVVVRIPGMAPEHRALILRACSVTAILIVGGYLGSSLLRRIWRIPEDLTTTRRKRIR